MTDHQGTALFFMLFFLTAVILPMLAASRKGCGYGDCRNCPHQGTCPFE